MHIYRRSIALNASKFASCSNIAPIVKSNTLRCSVDWWIYRTKHRAKMVSTNLSAYHMVFDYIERAFQSDMVHVACNLFTTCTNTFEHQTYVKYMG